MRKMLVLLIIVFLTTTGFRVLRPPTLSHPLDEEQVKKLNDYLEDIWNLQNGEFNFDNVTTPKTNANNGDLWFVTTGAITTIQYRADGVIFNVVPTGY